MNGLQLDHKTIRKLLHVKHDPKLIKKMTKKIAFSQFLDGLCIEKEKWTCCGVGFDTIKDCSHHISEVHDSEILEDACRIEDAFSEIQIDYKKEKYTPEQYVNSLFKPALPQTFDCQCSKNYKVILYYQYTDIPDPQTVVSWQKSLCDILKLLGKIRVATEGINGTVEGCECSINCYITNMLEFFPCMSKEDFKMSDGDGNSFKELVVKEHEELCSLGISPHILKPSNGGRHLTPEEFHKEMEKYVLKERDDTVLIDCRNFYESKIGYFEKALKPDLRKFSYFPAYVDKNSELFQDKRVLMYCTGGIRCERASAYMKQTGICKEVLQLKGGIHKYLEKYPDGHYKGKLFVFDDRYSIGDDTKPCVSECKYCSCDYDKYELCTTPNCRQLVLSCSVCRKQGKTSCCEECQKAANLETKKQECECTRSREQIPHEKDIS